MPDNSMLIAISAFSGLTGALATQIINAANTYFVDKRKQTIELSNQFRNKKVEIGESFYYVTGEKMAAIKKNIRYWRNWHNSRSQASLAFLKKEMVALNDYLLKLDEDNWKYNLINMYFNISLTNETVVIHNAKTHKQYLAVLDITEKINSSISDITEQLYKDYALAIYELCSCYEDVYNRMESDMDIVKQELLKEFAHR
jgi:hypothetical protein